uniref:Reverse transcriptase zinc-binding domain-containing protein n=1 Tax=Tanacetum cinerariifolium TaxID=118510 RepID=A0A699KVM1_TANCI|nr:hypothetical protein [Tanacetum cinerariifolium]
MACVSSASFSLSINGNIHCFLKDDLFIFARGDVESARVIINFLDEFKKTSRLGKLPMKYLGVPFIYSRLLNMDCKILVEKAKNQIEVWKNKYLSFAGRLQLCKYVISSMHVCWASVPIIPKVIIHDIQQLICGFLWCNGEYKCGKAKVAWDVICLPKYEGGLDITRGDFHLRNNVADLVLNRAWSWPQSWLHKAPDLGLLMVPYLDESRPDLRNSLKNQDRMRQWDVGIDTDLNLLCCTLCDAQPDSHTHLFFECAFSSQVWYYARDLAGMDLVPPVMHDILLYLQPMANKRTAKSVFGRLILAATACHIWLERNNRVFKKVRRSPKEIRDIIIVTVHLKHLTFRFKNTAMVRLLLSRWKMPKSFRLYG